GPGWHRGTSPRPALERDLCLNGRVATRINDLSPRNFSNSTHGSLLLARCIARTRWASIYIITRSTSSSATTLLSRDSLFPRLPSSPARQGNPILDASLL